MNSHEEFLDTVAVYALGALNKSEAAAVRTHLRSCEQCRVEYDALRPAVGALALSAQAAGDGRTGAIPSALLKARLLRTVRPGSSDQVLRDRRPWWPGYVVAAAAIVLALWATASNLMLRSDLSQTHEQMSQLHAQIIAANRSLAAQKIMIADVMNADAKRFPVAGGEVVRHDDDLYIAMRGMPAPPRGHVYQAWTQRSGTTKMSPSVTFAPDRSGVALVHVPVNAATIAAVAVSVEPEGGSKAPTTKPEFVVKLT